MVKSSEFSETVRLNSPKSSELFEEKAVIMFNISEKDKYLIGVISDTHGLLRSEIAETFKGTDLILHAGDIGRPAIIEALQSIAPVVAVRGNMDREQWADSLPLTEFVEIGSSMIYMLHDLYKLDIDPEAAGFNIVISGHTHLPDVKEKDGILFLNPGSAGPRRYDYPISVAILRIEKAGLNVQMFEFED